MALPVPRFMSAARLRTLSQLQPGQAFYAENLGWRRWPPLRTIAPGEDWVDMAGIDPTPLQNREAT